MNIPENFDRWMFDYLEGNLSEIEKAKFENFLTQNPSFDAESDAWQNAFVTDDAPVYPNESALIREKKGVAIYAWAMAFVGIVGLGTWIGLNSTEHASFKELAVNQINASHKVGTPSSETLEGTFTNLAQNDNNLNSQLLDVNNQENERNVTALNSGTESHVSNESNDFRAINGTSHDHYSVDTDTRLVDLEYGDSYVVSNNANYTNAESQRFDLEKRSLVQEKNKLTKKDYGSKYLQNPIEIASDFNLKKKSNVDYNSFSSQMKRVYKQIERRMGYPVGLVNLRDPELVVPENNLLAFNPGFTGGMLRPRFEANYRNQWISTEESSQQLTVSYDNYVHGLRGGIGLMVNAVDFGGGALSEYSIDLLYSPKINVAENIVFEPAIKVSMGILANNQNRLDLNQEYESTRGLLLNSASSDELATRNELWYKDYGLGFVLNTKWFYLGASADNIGRHYANVYAVEGGEPIRTPMLMTGVIGADYESSSKNMSISPFISYRNFGVGTEFWAGMNYRLRHFTIGGGYSSHNDYTASIGLKFKKFKMVYHYDNTTSILSSQKQASHNIGIRFNGEIKNARFKH